MCVVGRELRLPVLAALCVPWLAALPLPASGQSPRATGGDDTTLDEIIVTARKIEEDLLGVPQSVQVLSADFFDATKPASLYDLQFDVPGLVVTSSGMFGAGIALRGVTDQGGGSLAVAPHMDGIYLGRSMLALARPFDIERVEILKGPQGTLYGRNATAGSINVINRAPGSEFGAEIEAVAGSFDTMRVQGHVDLPAESIAMRLAVAASGGDGYIRNSADGRRFAEEDYVGARITLHAEPADGLTIDASARYIEDDGAAGDLWSPRPDFLLDPNDIHLTTVTLENPHLSLRNDVVSVNVGYRMKLATLRSISGYAYNRTRGLDDCAGLPRLLGCARGIRPSVYEQWSQEFQVAWPLRDAVDALLGVYVLEANETRNFHFSAPLLSPVPINDEAATARESAQAVFGQLSWRLRERWSVTAGLRLSHESSRVADSGNGSDDNATLTIADGSWRNASWRADLQYSVTNVASLYGSIATGFKSGGVTTERLHTGEFDRFGPESLLAYEVGARVRKPRWSLFASAFFYDIDDLQVRTTAILGNRVTSVIDNAAAARVHGLELETTLVPGERLSLSAGVVWLPRRQFVEFADVASGDSKSGNDLIRAPQWSGSVSARLRVPLGGIGDLAAELGYSYRSAFFFTSENDPLVAHDAFGLLNLFVRLEPESDRWYLFASARNLLDEEYFTQVFIQSSPGRPPNYEAGIGLRF